MRFLFLRYTGAGAKGASPQSEERAGNGGGEWFGRRVTFTVVGIGGALLSSQYEVGRCWCDDN